jgi:hypothetical protein
VPLRKIAVARLMSPLVISCVDSFRDAYTRTGMNLVQSLCIVVVAMARQGWRTVAGREGGVRR